MSLLWEGHGFSMSVQILQSLSRKTPEKKGAQKTAVCGQGGWRLPEILSEGSFKL